MEHSTHTFIHENNHSGLPQSNKKRAFFTGKVPVSSLQETRSHRETLRRLDPTIMPLNVKVRGTGKVEGSAGRKLTKDHPQILKKPFPFLPTY